MASATSILLAVAATALLAGCPGEDELVCVTVEPSCAPLYQPTWDNVFANTLAPKCGTGGTGCHEGAGSKGGLRLDESEIAYRGLTSSIKNYVEPGDVGCSELIQRIYSTSSALVMPRGAPLSEAERCALTQWVSAGAPGPVDAGVGP